MKDAVREFRTSDELDEKVVEAACGGVALCRDRLRRQKWGEDALVDASISSTGSWLQSNRVFYLATRRRRSRRSSRSSGSAASEWTGWTRADRREAPSAPIANARAS
jgi:hypothetical protein